MCRGSSPECPDSLTARGVAKERGERTGVKENRSNSGTGPLDPAVREVLAGAVAEGGHAAGQALARLCGADDVRVHPVLPASDGEEALDTLGRDRDLHCSVRFEVTGGARATVMLLVDPASGDRLAARLLHRNVDDGLRLHPDGRAALEELGNIVASSFLTGLGRAVRATLLPSVPELEEATLSVLLRIPDAAVTFVSRFEVVFAGENATGAFVASPSTESVLGLAEALSERS